MTAAAWFAVALTMVAAQATPPAADETAATALVERAAREYDEGRLAEALKTLEQARALSPRPGILYNIAQVHRAKRDCPAAFEAYTRFIAQIGTDDPNRERAIRWRAEMQACIEKAGGAVPVIAPDAPLPPIPPASAPPPGATTPPGALPPAPTTAPPVVALAPDPAPTPPTIELRDRTLPENQAPPRATGRTIGWVLAGVGAAAVLAAGFFQWRAASIQSDLENNRVRWSQAREDEGHGAANLARWLGGAALLSGGGATFLFLYNAPPRRDAPAAPHQQLRTVLVGWRGRF